MFFFVLVYNSNAVRGFNVSRDGPALPGWRFLLYVNFVFNRGINHTGRGMVTLLN